ncbi:MAG: endo-1,4-beta-xylanase [Bacteroidota bacterium]
MHEETPLRGILTNAFNCSLTTKLLTTTKAISPLLLLLSFIGAPLYAQSSLQELASPKKIYIGNLISNPHLDDPVNFRGGLADPHLREEYNAVVLENYMKMSFVLPSTEPADIHNLTVEELRATLTEDNIEAFLSNPDWADLRKRGHAMIWFNQAPNWLNLVGPTWTGQQVFDFSRKYILALGQICGNRVDEWDVINEAISDDSPDGQRIWRQGTWYRRANDGSMTDWGEATYENYIKMLFVWAREAQPEARLHINDYGIEPFDNSPASKNRFMRDQAKALKECGAPIDGVGFQSHLILSQMVNPAGEINQGYIDAIEQSIADLALADLEVAITELDIRICNNDRDEAFQEVAFQAYCEMALSQPNCHEVLLWGLRDEDNWITLINTPPFDGCQDAVIVEGDDYSTKPAYDGVAAAIMALPDQDDFGFGPLNPGDGAPANCGGTGSLEPAILAVNGPAAAFPGDEVTVSVNYLASDDQDVVVWFQLDSDPFTVYTQVITDVSAGAGTIDVDVEIPMGVMPATFAYRYLAFIAPDGEGVDNSFSTLIQNRVTVLGDDSQLIISSMGPESVSPGDSVDVNVSYSAVEDQEIVVWFQLDQQPFTTFQEFRQTAQLGQNDITVKLFIPPSVPVAQDAYQYQTLLVPTGGGFPERISNIAQTDIDVVMVSNIDENGLDVLPLQVYPNPTRGEFTVQIPGSSQEANLVIYSALGEVVQQQIVPSGIEQLTLDLNDDTPAGVYWLHVRRDASYSTVKLLKQ